MQDVIVIGGSYAGMAAALQLLRARRRVLIVDAGQRRNRFADASHGFLGQDGVDPAMIHENARKQLLAYPTLAWIDGTVAEAGGRRDDFYIRTDDGTEHRGRRLLLATGVVDHLPEVAGLAERWGKSVFHCPYCHGYELDRGDIGVIAAGSMSVHQAQFLPEWAPTTFLVNGAIGLDAETTATLHARNVTIEPRRITRIDGTADVLLEDGSTCRFAGLFVAPRCSPNGTLAETLGCALAETLMGIQVRTNEGKETTVPGVYACGDAARVPHSVSLAVADGAWAGMNLHRSLVWP